MTHDCPELVKLSKRYVRTRTDASRESAGAAIVLHVGECTHEYCSSIDIPPPDERDPYMSVPGEIAHFALYEG